MIDLGKGKQALYKIKLEDGTVLQIKKPSQGLLLKMVGLQELATNQDFVEVFETLTDILTDIFSRNVNGRAFTQEEVAEMIDIEMAMMIIQDYLNFCFGELGK